MQKVIIFDFDDTLIGTFEARKDALIHTANKYYQLKLTEDDVRRHWGLPMFDYFSASNRQMLLNDAKQAGLDLEKFHYIQTADDCVFCKPDPRVFTPLFNKLKTKRVQPESITYIGDSILDYEAANKAGINFIGVATGPQGDIQFKKKQVPYATNIKEAISSL